jgi:hypothetical protein
LGIGLGKTNYSLKALKEKEYELLKVEIADLHNELATTPLAANPLVPELLQEHEQHSVVR